MTLPRAPGLDNSLALLRAGYGYIGGRCRMLGVDAYEDRLLGQRTICCLGSESARIFYDESRMQRSGAMPHWVRSTLLGQGGVQGLDGAAHRSRKAMFMELMSSERLSAMGDLLELELERAAARWVERGHIVLRDEMCLMLFRAACRWSGVPLGPEEAGLRARDMDLMVAGGGSAVVRHWQALRARRRAELWAADLVERVRAGTLVVPEDTALAAVADHHDRGARHALPSRVAAVELLNVLRPTVAVSTYLAFAATALHQQPSARRAVMTDDHALAAFVMEVRRFYPFFPFAAALVRRPFDWNGVTVPAGRRVLFDIYGTNHDARLWRDPDTFDPDRFRGATPGVFELVAQGGGSHDRHHRCAGEWLTVRIMKTVLRFLLNRVAYRVPEQDLTVPMNRIPTGPRSGLRICDVRLLGAAPAVNRPEGHGTHA